jgi:hypothetical protein
MAVVAVGDFPDRAVVVAAIADAFAGVAPSMDAPSPAPALVTAGFMPHREPRALAYVERELMESSLQVRRCARCCRAASPCCALLHAGVAAPWGAARRRG